MSSPENLIPIIIDTDPGQDDAVAILLALAAHETLDVRAITAVAGNVPVDLTTANALRIRDLAGRPDVPVYRGAERPLLVELETAEYVCGPDGLDGAGLPPSPHMPASSHAVEAIITILRASNAPVTLCPVGPLTNIALAIRLAPDILPKIARIVIMGGAMGLGNITPAAEFNIHVDPHAADIVLRCGRPITLMGLHLTHQAIATPAQVAAYAAMGTATGRAIHGMLSRPRYAGSAHAGHPMHDPCVIAWLLWPELFTGRDVHVEVEASDGPQRGRTTIDWNNRLRRPPNAYVPDKVEAFDLFERMTALLSRLP